MRKRTRTEGNKLIFEEEVVEVKNGTFELKINTLTSGFCNSQGRRDADCEAYELADLLRCIANVIEGERNLMEDTVCDSNGNECGEWVRR